MLLRRSLSRLLSLRETPVLPLVTSSPSCRATLFALLLILEPRKLNLATALIGG